MYQDSEEGIDSHGFDLSDNSLRLSDDIDVYEDEILRFGPDHLFVRHAKKIISSLNGKIWVSYSVFTGSFFHIQVPVNLDEKPEELLSRQQSSSMTGPAQPKPQTEISSKRND